MNEELSPEDQFRLQVLLSQDLKAVRLDESGPSLHALTSQGEVSFPLHPNCRAERYLRLVREFLAGYALGSPGGYPVHLSRWTRHGQMESGNLGRLLLTGEPEAAVAVVHSPALTDELAAYAWWTLPTLESARLMLCREAVAKGHMGRVLTDFLVEHLPFLQEDHLAIIDTVAVLLNADTLTEEQRQAIWRRGKRSNSYYVAFLEMCPERLPLSLPPRGDHLQFATALADLQEHSPLARDLLTALSPQGQAFIATSIEILEKPETQEVVSKTLDALGKRFTCPGEMDTAHEAEAILARLPQALPELNALRLLAGTQAALTAPIFARSSAIGSLMRRKIEPVLAPVLDAARVLRKRPA